MERMIKRIAIRKDGTISMSEFRNFAEKYQGEIDKLEEENRNLKIEIGGVMGERDGKQMRIDELEEENKKLKECNLNLQEWIDNKEKVNKSLREELSKLKEKYGDIDY